MKGMNGKHNEKGGAPLPTAAFPAKAILSAALALVCAHSAQSRNLFLVSAVDGEGALIQASDGVQPVKRSLFLPRGERISIRPRGGIETLASGRTLRFGSGTSFILKDDSLLLEQGSFLYRAGKPGKTLVVEAPETAISIKGAGSLMAEVEPNGGFKLVGLLGRVRVTALQAERHAELLPGELLFAKPGKRGFADKVHINLSKLLETSYLVDGFRNLSSFRKSLDTMAKAQQESIAARIQAEVGRAKDPDTFEILPTPAAIPPKTPPSALVAPTARPSPPAESFPSRSALAELLGREPTPIPRAPVPMKPQQPQPSTTAPVSPAPEPFLPPLDPVEPVIPVVPPVPKPSPASASRPLNRPPPIRFPEPPPPPFAPSRIEATTETISPNFSAPVKPQLPSSRIIEPSPEPFPFPLDNPAPITPPLQPPPPSPNFSIPPHLETEPRPLPGRLFQEP